MKSLSEMSGIKAIAPFYADIDMDRGSGKMTVKEITGKFINITLKLFNSSRQRNIGQTDSKHQHPVWRH